MNVDLGSTYFFWLKMELTVQAFPMWTCMVTGGTELYWPINKRPIWIDKSSGQCLLEMHIINPRGAALILIKLYRLCEPWNTNIEASHRLLKIEGPKQKSCFSHGTFILLLENPFSRPFPSPEVRSERWPEPGIPAHSRMFAGCRLCVQQNTNTSPWCHDGGDTAVLADGNTLTEAPRPCQEDQGASCCYDFNCKST